MEILGHEILSNASIRPFDLTTLPTLSINTSTTDGFIPLSNGGEVIHYFLRSVSIYRRCKSMCARFSLQRTQFPITTDFPMQL